LLRQLGEAGDLRGMVAPAGPAALEHQCRDRDLPALVQWPDQILLGHCYVFEKDLVEMTVAIQQNQRPHRDPRRLHVDEQVADAVMLWRVGIGAHQ
jgi:hypothetical protein